MNTLTCLVIARDEASVLGRCLASLPPHDELIVVDTGSSDDTCEIAKTFGAKIAHFEWINDFSAARNFAESLATSDYVFWIDADEELLEGHELVTALVQKGEEASVRPIVKFLTNQGGEAKRPAPRQDLIHKRGSHVWKGSIHEWTEGPLGRLEQGIVYAEVQRPEGDKPHSWEALRVEAHERSDRGLFYLAAAHGAKQHYVEAIALYDYMLAMPGPNNSLRARAAQMKGHVLHICGDTQGATQSYLRAIAEHPLMAEPYFYLGEMFQELGQLTLAQAWYAASMPFPVGEWVYDIDVYRLREERLQEVSVAPVPV